jgi:hypothetical protein
VTGRVTNYVAGLCRCRHPHKTWADFHSSIWKSCLTHSKCSESVIKRKITIFYIKAIPKTISQLRKNRIQKNLEKKTKKTENFRKSQISKNLEKKTQKKLKFFEKYQISKNAWFLLQLLHLCHRAHIGTHIWTSCFWVCGWRQYGSAKVCGGSATITPYQWCSDLKTPTVSQIGSNFAFKTPH